MFFDRNELKSAELRQIVLNYGVANGNADDWDFVFKKWVEEEDKSIKRDLYSALAAARDPWVLQR